MNSIIYYIICIVFILKYSKFKLNVQCLVLVIFTLLFFSILKFESFATKRNLFVKKDEDDGNTNCPIKQKKFNLFDDEFCSDDGSIGLNNNTCTLSESSSHKYPVCKTYKCPPGYKLVQRTSGGFCKNRTTDETCAISQQETNSKNCNHLSMFYKLENHKYEAHDNILLEKPSQISLPECKIKCRDNENCNLFTHNKNYCRIFRNIVSGDSIKKYPNSSIYFKKLTNYKEEEDVEIKGHDLAQYSNKTILECAELCKKDSKCNAFGWDKELDVGTCMLKTSNIENDKTHNKVYNTYNKKFNYNELNEVDKVNTNDIELKGQSFVDISDGDLESYNKTKCNKIIQSYLDENDVSYTDNNNVIYTGDNIDKIDDLDTNINDRCHELISQSQPTQSTNLGTHLLNVTNHMKEQITKKTKCVTSYINRDKCIKDRIQESCQERCTDQGGIDSIYSKTQSLNNKCKCIIPHFENSEDCKLNCKSFFAENDITSQKDRVQEEDKENQYVQSIFNEDKKKCICKVPYKFIKNKDKPSGWLCKSSDGIVKKSIEEIQINENENYKDKEYKLKMENEHKKIGIKEREKNKEINSLYENLIKNGNYLFINDIASNLITNKINKIIIKKAIPNTMMKLSNIEIITKTGIISQIIKNISYSSILDNSNVSTLFGTPKNLNVLFSTKNEDNPQIIINFSNKHEINEIKIYGDVKNKHSIYPLRVELYEDDNLIVYYTRQSKYNEIEKSKDIPNLQRYKSENIKNWGNPDLFRQFCNVSGIQEDRDFCKVVQNKLLNTHNLECKTFDHNNKYQINNIEIGHKNTQYMKDETGNGHDDFCRCVGDFPQSRVKCIGTTKNGFEEEFYPIGKPPNCHGYKGHQLKNYLDINKKEGCNKDKSKHFVSAGFYYHINKYYYLFKNSQLNKQKIVLVSLVSQDKNNSVKSGYPKIFDEKEWANLPEIYYQYLDAVLYIGNNSVILFSNEYCIFYNIMEQSPYYINYITGEYIYNIDKHRKISEVFKNIPLTKVDAVDITDFTIKLDTEKLNRFLRILKNEYDIRNIDINKLIKYYAINWKELNDSETIANTLLVNIISLINECKNDKKNMIYFKSKIYYIFNKFYIPKCYLFSGNIYYEFIQPIGNTHPIIKKMVINSSNINGYTYAKVDAFITFYDTLQMSTLLYKGNNVIFYSLNSKNSKSVFNKIKNIHKNLWKISPNNLIKNNNNISNFKLNKSITSNSTAKNINLTDNIEFKIYYKNKLDIFSNKLLIDIECKYSELQYSNNFGKIVKNINQNELVIINLSINNGIKDRTYTKEVYANTIIRDLLTPPYYFHTYVNNFKIQLNKINI